MSDFSMAIELSKQKASTYLERMKAVTVDERQSSIAYNAYFQGYVDSHYNEEVLQKKYMFLLKERDSLLEENAKLRDKLNGKEPVKEVLKTPEPKHVLFI